jgi:Fic family protein
MITFLKTMQSFEAGFITAQPITHRILKMMRAIGEFKGKQELFEQRSPELLETMRRVATIQSIESSNRIEGIVTTASRIHKLVEHKTTPQNRSEQEIAGYRDVLETIHTNHSAMRLTPNLVLQLHRDLTQFIPNQGGIWKQSDNAITETYTDGTTVIRFQPVAAYLTPSAMQQLHDSFVAMMVEKQFEDLLLIATYVLDFLCIHPFADGNGRMARLLTLLLLYQSGYKVGRYISLETAIEQTRQGYYDTLYQSSQGWHDRTHTLGPWWEYFLEVILSAYEELESRVSLVAANKVTKRELVIEAIANLPEQFQIADLELACPRVSRPTIRRVLVELQAKQQLICLKAGRDAVWQKIS